MGVVSVAAIWVAGRVEAGVSGVLGRRWAGLRSAVEQGESLVGAGEVAGPGPVVGESEGDASTVVDEAAGGVQEPVARGGPGRAGGAQCHQWVVKTPKAKNSVFTRSCCQNESRLARFTATSVA